MENSIYHNTVHNAVQSWLNRLDDKVISTFISRHGAVKTYFDDNRNYGYSFLLPTQTNAICYEQLKVIINKFLSKKVLRTMVFPKMQQRINDIKQPGCIENAQAVLHDMGFTRPPDVATLKDTSLEVITDCVLLYVRRNVESCVSYEKQILALLGEHSRAMLIDFVGIPEPSVQKYLTMIDLINQAVECLPIPTKLKDCVREMLQYELEVNLPTADSMSATPGPSYNNEAQSEQQLTTRVKQYCQYCKSPERNNSKLALTYYITIYSLDTAIEQLHEKALLRARPFLMHDFGFDKDSCLEAVKNPQKFEDFDNFFTKIMIDKENVAVHFPKDDTGKYEIKKPSSGLRRFFHPCVTVDCQAQQSRLSGILKRAIEIKRDHQHNNLAAHAASCSSNAQFEELCQQQASMSLG